MNNKPKFFHILFSFYLILISGCRFIVPNHQETVALNSRGVFNSAAPTWASGGSVGVSGLPKNSGLVPETFGVPESASFSALSSGSSAVAVNSSSPIIRDSNGRPVLNKETDTSADNTINSIKTEEPKETSPLKRIDKVCPGIENDVISVIKTENTEQRISKYESITLTCVSSSDIWFWLAKDHLEVGNLSSARSAAQAALNLDQSNTEIKNFIEEINSGKYKSKIGE